MQRRASWPYAGRVAHDTRTHTAFTTVPILANDHVTLRALTLDDVPFVREISYYDGVAASTDEEAAAMLRRIQGDVARGASLHWGICLAGSDEVVGTCGFYRGFANGVGEIGYVLREAYRGRGIATAALRLVVAFGLDAMRLRSVVAYTSPKNLASRAVLARLGFRQVPMAGSGLAFVFP